MRNVKLFTIFSITVLMIITFGVLYDREIFTDFAAPLFWPHNVSCYFLRSNGIRELGAGDWDEAMLIPDRCIFFLETACFGAKGTSDAILDQRSACAVESAAKTNPSMNIFLLYLTPKRFSKDSAFFVEKLESYDNVYVRRVSLVSYFANTPLEDWYSRNMRIILGSEDPRGIILELLRLATLWQYGGIFTDLALILETPLETVTNFIAKRETQRDSTALLGIGLSTDLGKRLADFALDEVIDRFDMKISAERIIEKFCNPETMDEKRDCKKFSIYPNTKKFTSIENSTKYCPKIYENH